MVWKKLAQLAAVVLCIWFLVVFGVGEPLSERELVGMRQEQVRAKHGEPDGTRNRDGKEVWVYYTGLLLKARTDIEFKNGVVVDATGHSPAK